MALLNIVSHKGFLFVSWQKKWAGWPILTQKLVVTQSMLKLKKCVRFHLVKHILHEYMISRSQLWPQFGQNNKKDLMRTFFRYCMSHKVVRLTSVS